MIKQVFLIIAGALAALSPVAARAKSAPDPLPAEFMPSSEVRPGMEGEGRTVFEGFTPETFKVRILGVQHNAMPAGNLILARIDNPRFRQHGISKGMSGSPVYIDGRMIGAVAYGWEFSFEPICGIQPIEQMWSVWQAIGRPNAMIKIPGTVQGLRAIERCIGDGLNVNVTLLFEVARYEEVMEAFLRGLERRAEEGQPLDHVASVASFFVSRVDTKVDAFLERRGADEGLLHTAAIANAAMAYAAFQRTFRAPRWNRLAARGAKVQRPLKIPASATTGRRSSHLALQRAASASRISKAGWRTFAVMPARTE